MKVKYYFIRNLVHYATNLASVSSHNNPVWYPTTGFLTHERMELNGQYLSRFLMLMVMITAIRRVKKKHYNFLKWILTKLTRHRTPLKRQTKIMGWLATRHCMGSYKKKRALETMWKRLSADIAGSAKILSFWRQLFAGNYQHNTWWKH